jgi:hypothetical protein
MNITKIKLHSSVDLITNSSTVIFTYQDGSLEPLKDLVNEMLKTFGRTETFDDIFYADVFLEDDYQYFESYNIECPLTGDDTDSQLKELKLQIIKGEIEKPQWMIDIEGEQSRCDYYLPDTQLEILPKDEKYSELANKLLRYLNSTDHEATRDG